MSECVECGSGRQLVAHHTDYSEDRTVAVCRSCHQKIHANPSHELFHDDKPRETCVRVSNDLADELFDRKQRGESYEDVIWRLIEEEGGERT